MQVSEKLYQILEGKYKDCLKSLDHDQENRVEIYFLDEAGTDLSPEVKKIVDPHLNDRISIRIGQKVQEIDRSIFIRGKCNDEEIRTFLNAKSNFSFRAAIFRYVSLDEGVERGINCFVILPVLLQEGFSLYQRIAMVKHTMLFLKELGIDDPRLCPITSVRDEWKDLDPVLRRRWREGQILLDNVKGDKTLNEIIDEGKSFVNGKDKSFEIEEAVKDADIIVVADGAAGNLLIRSFRFLSNSFKLLSVPWFVVSPNDGSHVPLGESTFKKETCYVNHIRYAIIWYYLRNREKMTQAGL
jgi:predicted methyltransferase MtxX (methanogen marker protein 4)